MRVFLSYSHADKPFVTRLADAISRQEVDVWLDTQEMRPGDSIIDKVNDGLRESDYLVLVLSKNAAASEWVRRETNAAFWREIQSRNVVVIPILIEDCEIPPLLADKLYVDFRSSFDGAVSQLLTGLYASSSAYGGLVIREVSSIQAPDGKLALQIILLNHRRRTSWISRTTLESKIYRDGAGASWYLNKLDFHVRFRCEIENATVANTITADISETADFAWSERCEGRIEFIEEAGSKAWHVQLEMPTRFYVPAYERVAVRLVLSDLEAQLIARQQEGEYLASITHAGVREQLVVTLYEDSGEQLRYECSQPWLFKFIASSS